MADVSRVQMVRDDPHAGDVICAQCEKRTAWRVMLDGLPWATSCRDHLPGHVNAARRTLGLPTMSNALVWRVLEQENPRARFDSTPAVH